MGISFYFIVCLIYCIDATRLNLMEEVVMSLHVIKQCNYLKFKVLANISDKKSQDSVISDSHTGLAEDSKVLGCLLMSSCKQ